LRVFLEAGKTLLEQLTSDANSDIRNARVNKRLFVKPIVDTTFGLLPYDLDPAFQLWFQNRNFITWYKLYMNKYFEPAAAKLLQGGDTRSRGTRSRGTRSQDTNQPKHLYLALPSDDPNQPMPQQLWIQWQSDHQLKNAIRLFATCLDNLQPHKLNRSDQLAKDARFIIHRPQTLVDRLREQVDHLQVTQTSSLHKLVARVEHACDVLRRASQNARSAKAQQELNQFVQAEIVHTRKTT
jgi:hypothetical protein